MALALVQQFNKLNSYLIICNTLFFHRIETRSLSYSMGAKDNGVYIKGINLCRTKTFAKFVDYQIFCDDFFMPNFNNFSQMFHSTVHKCFPYCSKLDNRFLKVYTDKTKKFAKGIGSACFCCQKLFPLKTFYCSLYQQQCRSSKNLLLIYYKCISFTEHLVSIEKKKKSFGLPKSFMMRLFWNVSFLVN